MTKQEAINLLTQLDVTPTSKPVAQLEAYCDAQGRQIGVDNVTGEWVVLDADFVVCARAA